MSDESNDIRFELYRPPSCDRMCANLAGRCPIYRSGLTFLIGISDVELSPDLVNTDYAEMGAGCSASYMAFDTPMKDGTKVCTELKVLKREGKLCRIKATVHGDTETCRALAETLEGTMRKKIDSLEL